MERVFEAIYEDGVLRPVEPLDIPEHSRVRIIVESEEEAKKRAEEILALARTSCEGLSEEEIAAIDSARLDAKSFFSNPARRR